MLRQVVKTGFLKFRISEILSFQLLKLMSPCVECFGVSLDPILRNDGVAGSSPASGTIFSKTDPFKARQPLVSQSARKTVALPGDGRAPPLAGCDNDQYARHFQDPVPFEGENAAADEAIDMLERSGPNDHISEYKHRACQRQHEFTRRPPHAKENDGGYHDPDDSDRENEIKLHRSTLFVPATGKRDHAADLRESRLEVELLVDPKAEERHRDHTPRGRFRTSRQMS